ncbi:MAG: ABC transporter permease [Spirochaetales bacterium]|nr:ABC transporter permease [Spirochaetales bacterium]
MKLLSSYIKEMKIAARGFYFYIEIVMAIILLAILLFAVNETSSSKSREYLYYDMPQEVIQYMMEKNIAEGNSRFAESVELTVKPTEFEITNQETGETKSYNFEEAATFELQTLETLDPKTGELVKTVYITESEEDMIRIAYSESKLGAAIKMDETGELSYRYYLQGYETDRMENLLYILHNETPDVIEAQKDAQVVRTLDITEKLNNRQNLVPVFIAFMGSLMGFFIVMAYIYLDKAEGVIRAFAVTPSSIWKYLITKIMVILSTVIVSTSIITIPVMGGQPNYLLLYVFLLTTTFFMASLGLLAASFFDTLTKSFGAMYGIMIALMIPAFSYFIPSFDPIWLRFFPTYPMLQGFKEILLHGDAGYVLTFTFVFLAGGLVLFLLANIRFKKTLTV